MKKRSVEWIGEIPEQWETKYLFQIASQVKCKNINGQETNLLSLSYGKIKRKNIETTEGLLPASFEGYNIVEPGDIVLRLTDLQNDHTSLRVGKVRERGIITSAYVTLRPFQGESQYLYYALHAYDLKKGFYGMGAGVRQGLTFTEAKMIEIPFPAMEIQLAIADYLDEKCGAIDEIIEQAKETIKEYKAWKSSVIFEAVTKGLDPNVEMKDSGVEWIGKMPETWELKPFRYFLHERMEKNSPVKSTERLSLSIELGVTLYSEKTTNLDRFKDDFEQYKLAHEGDLVMNSMNMIVGASGVSKYFGCVSPAYYTFYDKLPDHASAKYCEYVFRSKAMLRILYSLGRGIYAIERGDDRVNTCRLKVPKEDLKALLLPSPSIKEQREIINYLDRKCSAIDEIIAEKEALIADMDAYKKSLIFETVTGKRKVC